MQKYLSCTVVLVLICCAQLAFAQNLFRYKDHNDQTRLSTSLPAEFVDNGYDILGPDGSLIERVEPVAELDEEQLAMVQAAQQKTRLDEALLVSYSTVDEIEAHRDRKLKGVKTQIGIIDSDRRLLLNELEKETQEKERLEKRNKEIDVDILARIETLTELDKLLLSQRQQREHQLKDITHEYRLKVERFTQLKRLEKHLSDQ